MGSLRLHTHKHTHTHPVSASVLLRVIYSLCSSFSLILMCLLPLSLTKVFKNLSAFLCPPHSISLTVYPLVYVSHSHSLYLIPSESSDYIISSNVMQYSSSLPLFLSNIISLFLPPSPLRLTAPLTLPLLS